MTGKWKKAAAALLAVVMAVLLVPLPTYAKETAKISVGSGSCDIGDEVRYRSVSAAVWTFICVTSGSVMIQACYSRFPATAVGAAAVCACSLLIVPHSACGLKQYRREVLRFL